MTADVILRRMLSTVPAYYETSKLYTSIQRSFAIEFAKQQADTADIRLQLHVRTATWGLKYWEQAVSIATIEADSYPIRRSRILSKLRAIGNFSADQIRSIASAFSNGEVVVSIDWVTGMITVRFTGTLGIPPNIDDLKHQLEDIVHAHLGLRYEFTFITWNDIDNAALTWDAIDAANKTWDELEVWKP